MIKSPNNILVKSRTANEYTIRMTTEISNASDFEDEFSVLQAATELDVVKIIVHSPGGCLGTSNLLAKAIKETDALTVGYIGTMCASAATGIILACEEWEIDSQSSFMIHTASFGSFGKAPELEAEIAHRGKMTRLWVQETYQGFLTQDEIDRVCDGKDYYFGGEELADRLTSFAEYRQSQRDGLTPS